MRNPLHFWPVLLTSAAFAQGSFCDPQGKVALFSNYDGGALTINVDQDIPGLRIGIVSYEFAVISITGPYASNVVEVQWAGFNGSNDHCGTGAITQSTVITGVTAGASQVVVYPPATLSNPNGWPNILCAYSCDISSEQGGCNTVDQVVDYFMELWGGTLLFHHTQYGCWGGVYDISDGGNCCVGQLSTGMEGPALPPLAFTLDPGGAWLAIDRPLPFEVLDAHGRSVARSDRGARACVAHLPAGVYLLRATDGRVARFAMSR